MTRSICTAASYGMKEMRWGLILLLLIWVIPACGEPAATPTEKVKSTEVPKQFEWVHIPQQSPGGKWLAPSEKRRNVVREFPKSGTLMLIGVTLSRLVAEAYGVQDRDIVLGRSIMSSNFDAVAHARDGKLQTARQMLRELIGTQLGLAVTRQRKRTRVMLLVPSPTGLRLLPSASQKGSLELGKGELRAVGSTISQLVDVLREHTKVPVIDESGQSEHYDYLLEWDSKRGAYAFLQALGDIGLALVPGQRNVESLLISRMTQFAPKASGRQIDGG